MPTDPELTDAAGLLEILSAALSEEIPVFSFEQPERFPLPLEIQNQVRLEFPDARRLWNAWSSANPETREAWSSAIPQPMYLKPPHITPAKRSWLVRP